ncbi:hypothetical protein MSPP1_002122 [Malassezia sp. CBS 17886]|nr:hypothetical protein MSPP1_002122 [Malassezia sp. CBS 17886]
MAVRGQYLCEAASEGAQLKTRWRQALQDAEELVLDLHANTDAPWRPVPTGKDAGGGAARVGMAPAPLREPGAPSTGSASPDGAAPGDVAVSVLRRHTHGTDVYRVQWEGPADGSAPTAFRAVLQTPEMLPQWVPIADASENLEVLGPGTWIDKTRFRLGWPTSARDAITLAQVHTDASGTLYTATSVPRTANAPAFLHPAPPYVRSHVHVFAVYAHASHDDPAKLAVTVYWAWDMRGTLLGMRANAIAAQLPRMVAGLVACVQTHASELPYVVDFGAGIAVTARAVEDACFRVEYAVLFGGDDDADADTLLFAPAAAAPKRSCTLHLSARHTWDVHVHAQAARRTGAEGTPAWTATVYACSGDAVHLQLAHAAIADAEAFVRVRVCVRRAERAAEAGAGDAADASGASVRVNGRAVDVSGAARTEPRARLLARLEEAGRTQTLLASPASRASEGSDSVPPAALPGPLQAMTPLATLVRRNYIYFTSLLQEPDAKWRRVADTRGVTVTQLDSIDPTLVVYRAEATFVGLSVWDFFATISTPSLAAQWDRSVGEAQLLCDVGGQSAVWHTHARGTWTASARDAVLVQTSYKSPGSIHLFSFSVDDDAAFPWMPAASTSSIRTQVDLRGWSIEALSPTTVHVTLLEQSDPRGWLSKSALPAQMIAAMAGAGEYTIHHGGAPIVTRLLNAGARACRYDHDTATYTLEYAAAPEEPGAAAIECELRCNLDTWAQNLDVVVTPPPASATCFRRHKLSLAGGGLWITIEHSAAALGDERVSIVVRKGPAQSRERGVVLLNGSRTNVDTDDLDEQQVLALARRRRTKPQRVPLGFFGGRGAPAAPADDDAPPAETGAPDDGDGEDARGAAPAAVGSDAEGNAAPAPRALMQAALDALFLLRRIHSERHPDPAGMPAGWSLVSERNDLYVRKKTMESFSPSVAVQRADKVVQGIAAETLLHLVSYPGSRPLWDERMDDCTVLESYGNGATTARYTARMPFPFRPRMFLVTSLTAFGAQASSPGSPSEPASPSTQQPVYFYATTSCADEEHRFDAHKLNPQQYPVGRMLIDGWIFETIDPYSAANYPIPSTRCTHVVAVDYGGALPSALNTLWNAPLPRATLQLEHFLRANGPAPSLRAPPGWIRVRGDGRDDDRSLTWTVQRPHARVALVDSDFHAAARTMRVVVLLVPGARTGQEDGGGDSHQATQTPPRTPTSPRAAPDTPQAATRASMRVCDVQVELQQYPNGYAIHVAWTAAGAIPGALYNLSQVPDRPPGDPLPLQVRVLDLPPSALQAATQNPVDRSHKHLVRVSLPEGAPDTGAPPWLALLHECGAAVAVSVTPLASSRRAPALGASDTGHVPVTCNDKVAEIEYGEDAARAAAVPCMDASLVDQLERVPCASVPCPVPLGWTSATDRDVLAKPVAIALAYAAGVSNEAAAAAAGAPHGAGADADASAGMASGKGAATAAGSTEQTHGDAPAAGHGTAPIFDLLQRNAGRPRAPTSRFNATLSTVTQMVTGAATRRVQSHDDAKTCSHDAEGAGGAAALPGSAPLGTVGTARGGQPRYRLSTVVLVAVVSLLLGSLIRSLMQPVDFILSPHASETRDAVFPQALHEQAAAPVPHEHSVLDMVARELESFVRTTRQLHVFGRNENSDMGSRARADANTQAPSPATGLVCRREIRRVFSAPILGSRWDVVVALVRG